MQSVHDEVLICEIQDIQEKSERFLHGVHCLCGSVLTLVFGLHHHDPQRCAFHLSGLAKTQLN